MRRERKRACVRGCGGERAREKMAARDDTTQPSKNGRYMALIGCALCLHLSLLYFLALFACNSTTF